MAVGQRCAETGHPLGLLVALSALPRAPEVWKKG